MKTTHDNIREDRNTLDGAFQELSCQTARFRGNMTALADVADDAITSGANERSVLQTLIRRMRERIEENSIAHDGAIQQRFAHNWE